MLAPDTNWTNIGSRNIDVPPRSATQRQHTFGRKQQTIALKDSWSSTRVFNTLRLEEHTNFFNKIRVPSRCKFCKEICQKGLSRISVDGSMNGPPEQHDLLLSKSTPEPNDVPPPPPPLCSRQNFHRASRTRHVKHKRRNLTAAQQTRPALSNQIYPSQISCLQKMATFVILSEG